MGTLAAPHVPEPLGFERDMAHMKNSTGIVRINGSRCREHDYKGSEANTARYHGHRDNGR